MLAVTPRVHTLALNLNWCDGADFEHLCGAIAGGREVLRRVIVHGPFPETGGRCLIPAARDAGIELCAVLDAGETSHAFAVEACVAEPPSGIRLLK